MCSNQGPNAKSKTPMILLLGAGVLGGWFYIMSNNGEDKVDHVARKEAERPKQ